VHKIAIEIGSLTLHWYGVLLAVGFLAAFWTASRRALHEKVSPEVIMDLGPWIILGAVVGARALYVVTYWRESFAGQPLSEIFMVQRGGLVYYGGLIGSSLGCIMFARRRKLALWQLADILAPSIPLGQMFGRLGCLMNGCCYGRACDYPWAIHFPKDHETYDRAVHPTQLYEALLSLVLYAFLAWLYRHKKFRGQVFSTYLLAYACLRSLVEYFRGDYPVRQLWGPLTPAQLVSIAIFLTGAVLYWVLSSSKREPMLDKV
jgi:phosphatidylglycerol:prolipoprotein diacylglycerol transferase